MCLPTMVSSLKLLFSTILLCATGTALARFAGSAMEGMEIAESIQREQLERMRDFLGPRASFDSSQSAETPDAEKVVKKREAPISFANPRAREFFVDGTKIPDGVWFEIHA